jgi:hypothetical protein
MILIWENNGIQFYMFKNHLKYKLRMWFYTFLLLLLSPFEWQWDSNNGILTWDSNFPIYDCAATVPPETALHDRAKGLIFHPARA